MSKKMCKRIFSVILSLGLVMVQSMNVNADMRCGQASIWDFKK